MLATLRRQTGTGLLLLLVMTVLCGIAYPMAVWGVSRIPGLSATAEGQGSTPVVAVDPVPADPNAEPYFHLRPAASAQTPLGPADPTTSGGSNKAQNSDALLTTLNERRAAIAQREGVALDAVPADAIAASASGLDPAISPDYANLQVPRVARVTGLPETRVRELVAQATSGRILGFLGEPTVNVPTLNALVAGR